MKNKESMQKIYKRRRIAFVTILAIALLCLIISLLNKNGLNKIAQGENTLMVGSQNVIDVSQITSNEPNVPVVGAGMIPIKWNPSINMWQITTTSDKEWYNYANGNYANVMLSDGYYKSELQVGITKDQLAENNVGIGISNDSEQLGTIYTWIPRFAYLENDIKFLKNNSILEYEWATESCFNLEGYGANSLDLAFTGIWVGEKEYETSEELETRNSEMLLEDNIEGLISNEKIFNIAESEKTAIQKLTGKYANTNTKILQDIDGMKYRQVIKIVNTNSRIPIVGKHTLLGEGIKVDAKYAENTISFIADKNGNKLSGGIAPISEDETQYTFYIVDSIGNIRKYRMSYGSGKPDIKRFNKNTTYYVTYDPDTGEEISNIPIGEKEPENWYNYAEQKWANIVVRDQGQENYFVWIPRYMYKIKSEEDQTIDAKLVDLENVWTDPKTGKTQDLDRTDYKLPEAFTWEDPEDSNNKIQLTGFWASKYKLRASEATPEITGGSGTIYVKNVVEQDKLDANYTYEMYLIKDGKRVEFNEETGEFTDYTDTSKPIQLTGNYTFTNLPAGTYAINIVIKDGSGAYVKSIANEVVVLERVEPNVPDTSSFNQNLTYYVTYDEEGNEDSSIPVGDEPPKEWYNYDKQKWANVVVRENGTESYFVWIPKYEYTLNTTYETTKVQFIAQDKTNPDLGYKIPEAFTWEDPKDETKTIQLAGFWASKYKLRDDQAYTLSASVTAGETNIKISSIVAKVDGIASYDISLIQNGKILTTETMEGAEHSFKGLEAGGTYAINIVAKNDAGKMIAGYSTQVTLVKIDVDLTGFNKATTYYVTYDENGIENSTIPIGENPPDGWYNYAEQKWANIVVRDQGQENYYVWIPRYQYVVNDSEEKVKAEIIPVSKETADPGYKIPEAFTWTITTENDEEEKTLQLAGFWASKYKLRASVATPEISGGSGVIYIKNINEHVKNLKLDSTNYTYEIYLISEEGKRLVKSGDSYVEGTSPAVVTEESNYTFTNVPEGKYSVNIMLKDKTTNNYYMGIANYVTVTELKKPNAPDLTGFNPNLTFYVTYNDVTGAETSNTPINDTAPDGWYDYDTQKWANVVVRDNGSENYFVWIPRYKYAVDKEHESTKVIFIPASETNPGDGYKIPEAFTWENPDNPDEKIQLAGFWTSKYKLRDDTVYTVDATVAAGANKIRVSDVVSATNPEGIFYRAILIQDGKKKDEKSILTTSGDAVFGGLKPGKYSVLVEQWNGIQGTISAVAKEVVVQQLDSPDLTGFNVEKTYIVTYDDSGNETSTQTLKSVLAGDAEVKNDALVSGKVDESKITGVWYDYTQQKWANIVVKDNINGEATENYFVWIPRYEYVAKSSNEKVKAILIPSTQETATPGYKIPEAFTWEDPNNPEGKIQLPGFWASKYKLRK